ncbi:MAG: membrane protein insertase YidC [Bacilli bacterium]
MLLVLYNIFIKPIEILIEFVFVFFLKPFNNVGLSIIGVSVFISLITLPLYHIAEKIQNKERNQRLLLKPGIDRIKATFKGDEQYMILNTFYKQNNYHPIYALRNSLSLLIQIPFFIAAYQFLSHLTILKGQSFLFISDLGVSDSFASLGPVTINILPILMTLINLGSAIVYTKGFPLRDRIQTFGIPIVFLLLLYNSPAGLVFYWTLNNIFSLIKNIVYKSKKPLFILYLLALVGTSTFVIFTLIKRKEIDFIKQLILLLGVIFVASVPILIKMFNYIVNLVLTPTNMKTKTKNKLFSLSVISLFLIGGVVIPINLISSSPIEFSFIENVAHPLTYLIHTGSVFFGLMVVWPIIIYFISSNKVKTLLSLLMPIVVFTSVINTFIFAGSYGDIDSFLIFENSFLLNPNILQTIVPIIIFSLVILIIILFTIKNAQQILANLLIIVIITSLFSSTVAYFRVNKEFNAYSKIINLDKASSDNFNNPIKPLINLSSEAKNVVVIFLDRAISSFFPIIIDQFPYLKETYKGFTYYPNTLSLGMYTISGGPPIMGGYEYSPEMTNKRDKKKLADKHNEATLVLPVLFSELGYRASVFNPPLPNYSWTGDLSVFDPYENINAYETKFKMVDRYKSEHKDDFDSSLIDLNEIIYNRFPRYVFLKMSIPVLRPLIYDEGNYYLATNKSPFLEKLDIFLSHYTDLYYLPELTKVDDGKSSFIFFDNETPHRPVYLQAPEYKPTTNLTNTYSPLQNNALFGTYEEEVYHVNVASIFAIGKWLDYLKEQGAYDNTRIIIVADHGDYLSTIPFESFTQSKWRARYHPLFLVKDFGSQEFNIDETFMTNADVPIIAADGIINPLVNPFTKENMIDWVDKDNVKVFKTPWHINDNKGNKFQYDPKLSFTVKDNIFVESNWESLEN